MGKKLTAKEIEKHSKDIYQGFDICAMCSGVELEGEMNSISEESDQLVCNECKEVVKQFVKEKQKNS